MSEMEITVNNPNDKRLDILRSWSCGTSKNDSDSRTTQIESTETTIKEKSKVAKDSYFGSTSKTKEKLKFIWNVAEKRVYGRENRDVKIHITTRRHKKNDHYRVWKLSFW